MCKVWGGGRETAHRWPFGMNHGKLRLSGNLLQLLSRHLLDYRAAHPKKAEKQIYMFPPQRHLNLRSPQLGVKLYVMLGGGVHASHVIGCGSLLRSKNTASREENIKPSATLGTLAGYSQTCTAFLSPKIFHKPD